MYVYVLAPYIHIYIYTHTQEVTRSIPGCYTGFRLVGLQSTTQGLGFRAQGFRLGLGKGFVEPVKGISASLMEPIKTSRLEGL